MESLLKTSYTPLELVVVDNNSTDGSLEYIRQNYPRVKLIEFRENLGYSRAYNAAVPQVYGDYAVLLNFDVEVEPGWLDQAIELLEADPRLAAVQPKLKQYQNHENFEYSGGSGGFIDRYGYPFVRGRVFDSVERDHGQYDDVVPIFWATGAALIVRKSAFFESGGLDGDFFMHMEELDLCWRFWLAGWGVKVAPQGTVFHWAGAALSADRYHKMYFNHRNGLTMMFKNYSIANVLRTFPLRFLLDWVTVFASLLRQEPKRSLAVAASHWYFFTRLPKLIRKRRIVQKRRRIADRDYSHVIFPGSIVWRYFVHKQKTYRQLTTEC